MERCYNQAMMGMDSVFDERKSALKNFNKKNYSHYFEICVKKYSDIFASIEEVFCETEEQDNFLEQLICRLIENFECKKNGLKWKFQKESLESDCTLFLVVYFIPAILEYQGKMSEKFANTLINRWNQKFNTNIIAGTYEQIQGGFSNRIFGISLGTGK